MKIETLQITITPDENPDTSCIGELTDKLEPGVMSTRTWEFLKWHFGEAVDVPQQNYRNHRFFKPYARGEKVGTKVYYKYGKQDAVRMQGLIDGWWTYIGIVAKATVSYQIADGSPLPNRRLETFTSGGLWGIESDAACGYLLEVATDQIAELREHLQEFDINPTDEEWAALMQEAMDDAEL